MCAEEVWEFKKIRLSSSTQISLASMGISYAPGQAAGKWLFRESSLIDTADCLARSEHSALGLRVLVCEVVVRRYGRFTGSTDCIVICNPMFFIYLKVIFKFSYSIHSVTVININTILSELVKAIVL